ncbi:MAG: phage holin family protein [Rikenellaceae bacterium]|nr:phage holin family protein [Rikenellaceae bacterium]
MWWSIERYLSGVVCALCALFMPIRGLVVCAVTFVVVDFVVGVLASWLRARKRHQPWMFESRKAWRTVYKALFVMAGICMAWLIDSMVLDFAHLNLAKCFTGFVCGVEFWSYLENAAEISDHPMFRSLQRIMKNKISKTIDNDDTEQRPPQL